ncbi:MAG: transporter substrate-binding domain-containing protein [Candidatus Latescibacteria bacterium]|jgi:ABC-type amino acid transport substrate-binding protein|nr:transporter substrate-binding domain-containing protein [Candidatus Latescibacterota bacterium]
MRKSIATTAICLMFAGTASSQQAFVFTQIVNTPDQIVGAEVLRVAFKRMDIPVTFKLYPGARALEISSSGKADGEIHRIWEIGEKYPTLRRVPTPINYIETVGFVRKDSNFDIKKCEDLKPYRVATVRGIKHTEICSKGVEALSVSNDGESMMKFLKMSRADVALDAGFNGLIQLRKSGLESTIEPLPKALGKSLLYAYVHEKHTALITKLDSEFQKMVESGEMSAIRERVMQEVLADPDSYKLK